MNHGRKHPAAREVRKTRRKTGRSARPRNRTPLPPNGPEKTAGSAEAPKGRATLRHERTPKAAASSEAKTSTEPRSDGKAAEPKPAEAKAAEPKVEAKPPVAESAGSGSARCCRVAPPPAAEVKAPEAPASRTAAPVRTTTSAPATPKQQTAQSAKAATPTLDLVELKDMSIQNLNQVAQGYGRSRAPPVCASRN